jgi:hypothetical protein
MELVTVKKIIYMEVGLLRYFNGFSLGSCVLY